jgi:flagellar hook-length control protein FliK
MGATANLSEVSPQHTSTEAATPELDFPTVGHQVGPYTEPVPIVTQVFDHMHVAMKEGRHELRLALTPEHLGTVRVEISADHQEVHARLLVETPLVKEILEENLYKLKDALQAQGLQLHELNVSVGQHFARHESTADSLLFDERSWKTPRDVSADHELQDTSNTPHQVRATTDMLQIDVFV